MIRYSYQLSDFRQWLRGFSRLLHVPAAPGYLTIPRDLGDGSIRTAHLPEGISCVVMNFSLCDDLQLVSEATSTPGLSLFFNQIKASDIYMVRENGHPCSDRNHRGHLLLSSTAGRKETVLPRNSRLKGVHLYFPPSFLRHRVREDVLSDLFRLADGSRPTPNPSPSNADKSSRISMRPNHPIPSTTSSSKTEPFCWPKNFFPPSSSGPPSPISTAKHGQKDAKKTSRP
ncbi:hypothetical protein ACQ86N_09770 [Puia sp. P3]|uniref:hypothetical protein n=1 Tax=Puia sp. P3 TaxID=3423952 RepID=UPI003D670F6D